VFPERTFVVTTDSSHKPESVSRTWPGRMVLTGMDQLWIADITYIRLRDEFVYVAVILDATRAGVIGWALDRTRRMKLTLSALEWPCHGGWWNRVGSTIRPGLAYASDDYTDLSQGKRHRLRMSRKGIRGQRGL